MRIASVLHDASPEPDGAPLLPAVALERDGALYRVSALARAFGPRYAALADDPTLREAVVALGGATLRELDERLKAGERPTSARILPGAFTWLPPCDTDRAAFVACGPCDRAGRAPSFRIGSARTLFGHDATVPLPPNDAAAKSAALDAECALAIVLGDDLFRATAAEAEHAILGYTLLVDWCAGLAAQLGPVLVTREEAGSIAGLRAQLRVDGVTFALGDVGGWTFSPAESIAWISHHVPLCAGDVIGAGCLRGGSTASAGASVGYGARVELAVERLGRLCGKAARGPEMRAWRSRD